MSRLRCQCSGLISALHRHTFPCAALLCARFYQLTCLKTKWKPHCIALLSCWCCCLKLSIKTSRDASRWHRNDFRFEERFFFSAQFVRIEIMCNVCIYGFEGSSHHSHSKSNIICHTGHIVRRARRVPCEHSYNTEPWTIFVFNVSLPYLHLHNTASTQPRCCWLRLASANSTWIHIHAHHQVKTFLDRIIFYSPV